MPDRSQNSSPRREETNSPWRAFGVGVLLVLAGVATAAAVVAAWARPLIYDTDTWVETVGPLPENDAVATAVADDAVTALFESQDVEGKIQSALPPQASFLASPLTDQIRTRANVAAKQLVQSDQFSTIWTGANRLAHDQFLKLIENKADERLAAARQKAESVTLDLGQIRQQVRSALGISGQELFDQQAVENAATTADEISINLENTIKEVRHFAEVVDRLNRVLPIVAISLFLAALAVSRRRQKTFLAAGVTIIVTSALLLIALKAIRPEVEGMGASAVDQAALGAAWDQVTAKLHEASSWLMVPGFLVVAAALVAGPYGWAVRLRKAVGMHRLAESQAGDTCRAMGRFVDRYRNWFRAGGLVIAFGTLLLLSTVTLAGIVGAISLTVAYLSLVELSRQPEA